jgi:hypothetical protein
MSPQSEPEPKKTDAEEIVDLKKEAARLDTNIKQLDDMAHQYGIRQMVAEAQVVVLTEQLDEAKKRISELEEAEQKRKGVYLDESEGLEGR